MSDRARDVVRYVKAIEESGGYRGQWLGDESGGYMARLPTRDRMRADMLDMADLSDEELRAGFEVRGMEMPPLDELRERLASYR